LLCVASLLIRSLIRFGGEPLGFESDHLLTASLILPRDDYARAEQRTRLYDQFIINLGVLPGVQGVALTTELPPSRQGASVLLVEGRPIPTPATAVYDVKQNSVTADYFRIMRIPVRRGRSLDARDRPGSEAVVVVNEALVRRYFSGEDPI